MTSVAADSNDVPERLDDDDQPRPYSCTLCDKRYAIKDSLNHHKQIHNGGKIYPCTECDKEFPTQRYLRQHMNVHSAKYKCDVCGKGFRSTAKLTLHAQGHSGAKPYECFVCDRYYYYYY